MNWQKIKKHDWAITVICLLLMALGLLVIFSTTYNTKDPSLGAGSVSKQIVFIIIGFIAYFVLLSIDFSWFENKSVIKVLYVILILLLIYVKFFGTKIAGTNRWINIGFFNLQPSEYAKIMIIMVTAVMFAAPHPEAYIKGIKAEINKKRKYWNFKFAFPNWLSSLRINPKQVAYLRLLLLNSAAVVPLIVLTLIEPSLGNALICLFIWGIILIVLFPDQKKLFLFAVFASMTLVVTLNILSISRNGEDLILAWNYEPNLWLVGIPVLISTAIALLTRTKALHLLFIIGLTIAIGTVAILGWNHVLTDYQRIRIDTFMAGPESDPRGSGYQVIQSKIAIGSGMLLGRGFLQGAQSSMNASTKSSVLTQSSTDFIFAAFAEQFGFLGTIIVIGLYTVLILRVIKAGVDAPTNYGKFFGLGIALLLLMHVFINIGMNLGKLPVTGIPLPLMSYGGSSVLMVMISLGLVQSINTSRKPVDIADNLMLISHSLLVKEK